MLGVRVRSGGASHGVGMAGHRSLGRAGAGSERALHPELFWQGVSLVPGCARCFVTALMSLPQ